MSRFRATLFRKTTLVGIPVVVVLLLIGSFYWLLHTSSGATWMWSRLEGTTAIDVRSSRVSGDLGSGFIVEDLEYRSAGLDLLVRRAEVEAGIAWWPMSVMVRRLSLQYVEITTRAAEDNGESANEEMDIRTTLANLEIPLPLAINEAILANVSLHQDNNPPLTLFEYARLQAALDDRLIVDDLEIRAEGLEASLQGHLGFESPFELAAAVQGRYEISGAAGETVLVLPFALEGSGDLDVLQLKLTSQEHGLQLGGEVRDPVLDPVWNIKVLLDHLLLSQVLPEQNIALSGLSLDSQGGINDWSFEFASALQADQLHDARVAVIGTGSLTGIEVGSATVTGSGLDIGVSGKLDWSSQVTAGLNAVIRQLDLSIWLPDWPAGKPLAGGLDLNWSANVLKIPAGRLTVTGTDMTVRVEADIDAGDNKVNALLDWNNLSWPLDDPVAGFSSKSGQLSITGGMDDWLAGGTLDIRVGEYPRGQFEIQGGGNSTSTHMVIPAGEILGGTLSGEADADWSGGLNWAAKVKAQGIDTGPVLPEWPGWLDTEIEITAQSQPQQIQIELKSLQGLLRNVPVTANGGLLVTQTSVTFNALQVRTDGAMLLLNGATAEPDGATVKFSGDLPSVLLQGAVGSLELEGRYSSHASHPLLEFQSQANGLRWNGLSIGSLAVSTPKTAATGVIPSFQLDASSLALNDLLVSDLSLSFGPVGERYELKTSLTAEEVLLKGVMSMLPQNRDEFSGGHWQGMLAELEVAAGPAYIFRLPEPAAFAWSWDAGSLGPVCLTETGGASLCLELEYQSDGDWSVVADATAVPLDYLRDILALDVHFEQLLEGHMEWHQPHEGAPSGGAEFRITAGGIHDLLDNEILARTNEGRFAFALRDGNIESGVLKIEFPGTGFIDVDFEVLDLVEDAAQRLQGRAVTRLDNFKLAGQLALPGVDAVDGQFEANIRLGGSLSNPEFDGDFKLSNGFIHYAPIGLKLEDIELEGQVKDRDRGDFEGRFRAGEGLASIDGRFQFDDAGPTKLEFDLAGNSLLLVNTEELNILTQTDLDIVLGPERMEINGHVLIPSARLTPENLLLEDVRDSEDLVIETPGNKTDTVTTEEPVKNRIYGKLEVGLGDDVLIKVPGIETRIKGSTVFNWTGEPLPMARGGYTLQGKVDVYGPTLRIRNGTINFPGVPADNPLLNIRAGRDVFGNTQIRSAGVQVIGSLKRPVLEAYTDPVTSEDRAWSLLLTGTDFDQAQGVSGFNLGTYIAPKLYVSYGISLFDEENVISARYDLKKGFGVKVTSGQRETGLDVSYTIDR